MYNSELEMEYATSESPAECEHSAWSDLAAKLSDTKAQSSAPSVDEVNILLPELTMERVRAEPAQTGPQRDSPVPPKETKPASNPVQDLIEIAIPGIAVAKVLAPGAKVAAKTGEKVVEKAVVAPAEKVTNEVIRKADDAAKALEEAGKRAADELARKADEAKRTIDEATRKAADDAAKTFERLFGKPKK